MIRWPVPAGWVILLAGCSPAKQAEDRRAEQVRPAIAQPVAIEAADVARKRACIEALTADAEPRLHALLRSLCSEWVERDIPGIALAVVEPGGASAAFELGVRCLGEAAKVETATAFRVGSISKTVSAALALGLVEARDDLSLTSDATRIPGFATQAGLAPPQLGPLLRHTSGLGEIDPGTLVSLDGAWLPALAQSPAAGPSGQHRYSNAGYSVVGAILEVTSGQRYAELVATRIAKPLELASMTAETTGLATACGHLASDRDRHPIPIAEDLDFMPGDPSWMTPAGGVLSSATDLANFALALGSEPLPGSAAMLEPGEALAPEQVRAGHHDERYGYGLRSWQLDGETRAYGHSGNNGGFAAELLFVPGERAIVILANTGVELPASLAAAEALLTQP